MELTITLLTKNDYIATQKIKYEDTINSNPSEFFRNLDGYIRKYIFEFQKNNANSLKMLEVSDSSGNILKKIDVLEE